VAYYLLGTGCLLDIARYNHGPAHKWFLSRAAQHGLFPDDVVISAFSVAQIEALFRANPPSTPAESQLAENAFQLIKQFALDDAIVGATKNVIDYWSRHLNFPIPYPTPKYPDDMLGFEEKLVLATAKEGNEGRGYILVDHKRDIHDQLGLLVHDPY
jgi:hypothetical protein